jgi:hypothetical protein
VLERYSSSIEGNNGYVFYEDNQKFNFTPLQELYQQEPIVSYKYGLGGTFEDVDKRNEESFERIQDIRARDENSLSDHVMDGLYGSKHSIFDLITKTFVDDSTVLYNKDEWYNSNKSLGKHSSRKKQEQKEDVIRMSYGSGVDDLILHQDRIDGMMKRIELELFIADILVFGDSKLKVGDVIEAYIPNLNMDQQNLESPFSGKFLITAIKHMLKPETYMQALQIQKDAYEVIEP